MAINRFAASASISQHQPAVYVSFRPNLCELSQTSQVSQQHYIVSTRADLVVAATAQSKLHFVDY